MLKLLSYVSYSSSHRLVFLAPVSDVCRLGEGGLRDQGVTDAGIHVV